MSKPMTADQLVAQLKKWHVPFKATTGWKTRNRNHVGAWDDMHWITNHHTATPKSASIRAVRRLLQVGRSDLPGPLVQMTTRRDGIVELIGWGRANQAGAVRPEILAAAIADRVIKRPSTTSGETVDGNRHSYGNEVQNDGVGEKYTDAQLLSIVLLNAAICDFHGWTAASATQHKCITARKIDMSDITQPGGRKIDSDAWLRHEVGLALEAGPGNYVLPWQKAPDPAPAPPPPPPAPVPSGTSSGGQVATLARHGVASLRLHNARAASVKIVFPKDFFPKPPTVVASAHKPGYDVYTHDHTLDSVIVTVRADKAVSDLVFVRWHALGDVPTQEAS